MTIQTHSDANAFRAGAQATGRADHPWHAPRHDRPALSAAEVPASTLHWLVEALVLGPDRTADDSREDPRDRTRRLRAAVQRREDMRDAVHGLLR